MPGIFHQPASRRDFLRYSTTALAALGAVHVFGADQPGPTFRMGLLSDLHISADPLNENRKFVPWENLKTIMPQVSAIKPNGVLVNGDIARLEGLPADYEAVRSAFTPLAAEAPVYLGLGNHDHRENFLKSFPQLSGAIQKAGDRHVVVVETPVMRLVILDSLLFPNKTPGLLGKAQRDWLGQYLDGLQGKPVVIFVHHTLGDGDGELLDAEKFLQIVKARKIVKAVFYGHSHQYSFKKADDLHLINLPAVGYNFVDAEPVGWVDAAFREDGAELTLRAIGGNLQDNGRTTSLRWRA